MNSFLPPRIGVASRRCDPTPRIGRIAASIGLLAALSVAGCDRPPPTGSDEERPPTEPPEGAELVWPLAASDAPDADSISYPYGPRYIGRYNFHAGIDLPASPGTPVRAVLPGRVVLVSRWDGQTTGPGNAVLIAHSEDRSTSYLHLREIEVAEGDSLELGDRLGTVGQTGASSPHLHLGYFVGLARDTRVRDERHSRNPLELLHHSEPGPLEVIDLADSVVVSIPLQSMTVQTIELHGAEETRILDYLEVVEEGFDDRQDPVQQGVRISVTPPASGRFALTLRAYPYPFQIERAVVRDVRGDILLDTSNP